MTQFVMTPDVETLALVAPASSMRRVVERFTFCVTMIMLLESNGLATRSNMPFGTIEMNVLSLRCESRLPKFLGNSFDFITWDPQLADSLNFHLVSLSDAQAHTYSTVAKNEIQDLAVVKAGGP